ncbi:nuclear transport factor 2 family protein [Cronobacter dublinensis]
MTNSDGVAMSANNARRVAAVCEKFRTLDMEIIMSCFTKDVTVNYNQLDTLRGKAALNEFLTPRYRVLGDYQLDKKIVMEEGDRVCVEVRASYVNKNTQVAFQSRIFEILVFEENLISYWDYIGHSEEVISWSI